MQYFFWQIGGESLDLVPPRSVSASRWTAIQESKNVSKSNTDVSSHDLAHAFGGVCMVRKLIVRMKGSDALVVALAL